MRYELSDDERYAIFVRVSLCSVLSCLALISTSPGRCLDRRKESTGRSKIMEALR
jgi:hypothetical protein